MYATISELLKSFGIDIPLPIQTFGFFVAIAFIVAAYLLSSELRRKEALGLFKPSFRKVETGKEAGTFDYILAGLIGFLIGFKAFYMIMNYSEFVDDPQSTLLSGKGNFVGGLLVAAAMIYLRYRESESQKKQTRATVQMPLKAEDHVGNIILLGVIGGLLGAKIFHNLENPSEFMADPIGALLSFSGLTFYGGLIVASILIIRYGIKNGLPALHLTDAAAPALMLSYGVGRIGCMMSGDGDWGIVNNNPKPGWMSALPDWMWSFKFPHNVNNEGIPIPGCVGRWCHELPEAVYPTSFYETLMAIVLFGILWMIRKRIQTPGMLFSIYLILNGAERFLIESIRVNTQYHIMGMGITQAQIISTTLMILGIVGIWYSQKLAKDKSHATA
ncbi:MAG TPA: prolipoprotein diacylglyceryl transferase [Flavobacteriales bacterium]|nr:prolipoprotein diacylglyceryl transferase [Flavobacteriales bacterium]